MSFLDVFGGICPMNIFCEGVDSYIIIYNQLLYACMFLFHQINEVPSAFN